MISIHKLYEPAQEDEENAVDLYIEPEMSLEEVASKVLKLTQDLDRKSVKSPMDKPKSAPAKSTKVCDIL